MTENTSERRIESDQQRQILPAANRVGSVDELRSTDTPRFRRIISEILASASKPLNVPEGFEAVEKAVKAQHEQSAELLKRGRLDKGVIIPDSGIY